MVRLNPDRDYAARRFGAELFQLAWFTVFHREFDLDDLVVKAINGWRPTQALLPRRTLHLLRFPVDLETSSIKALLGLALPLVVGARGGDEIDALLPVALHKLLGFCVIGVCQIKPRQMIGENNGQ